MHAGVEHRPHRADIYIDPFNRDELAGIAALDRLASSWRDYAARRLQSGRIEDWAKRLEGHEAAGD
ncbi:hypothetical protein E0H51_29750 [Rhizobium leguminosarum bv. viciae]|nr:hypothetical protein E0H51_29750 [Rhizobium leguminosarum bv. viciae]